ncbi:hypothetical protein BH10PSE12_BH10PSE12_36460 [soil metagenome]
MLEFSFGEVEAILSAVHRIRPDKAVAFRARLKHLQREGWPMGANTGTGKKAVYTLNSLMQMAMALELLQVGITPKRAVAALLAGWSDLALSILVSRVSGHQLMAWEDSPLRAGEELFWVIRPEALQDLSLETREVRPGNLEILVQRSDQVMPDLLSFTEDAYVDFGPLWRSLVIRVQLIVIAVDLEIFKVRPGIEVDYLLRAGCEEIGQLGLNSADNRLAKSLKTFLVSLPAISGGAA